jgi:predicted metal-dependent hydrolase
VALTFKAVLRRGPDHVELQDYVIVHELLHFSTPNHGRLWKSLMRAHLGDYETREQKLRELAAESRCRVRS